MNLLDGLVEFWTFDSLDGLHGNTLVSLDNVSHYEPGKIGQGWKGASYDPFTNHVLECTPLTVPIDVEANGLTVLMWAKLRYTSSLLAGVFALCPGSAINAQEIVQLLLRRRELGIVAIHPIVTSGGLQTTPPSVSNSMLIAANGSWVLIGVRCVPGVGIDAIINGALVPISTRTEPFPGPLTYLRVCATSVSGSATEVVDCLGIWQRALDADEVVAAYNAGLGWEPSAQTIKQHLIVSPTGIIQPVGSSIVVPGWV